MAFLVRVIVGCEEIAAVFMDIVGVDLGGEVAGWRALPAHQLCRIRSFAVMFV